MTTKNTKIAVGVLFLLVGAVAIMGCMGDSPQTSGVKPTPSKIVDLSNNACRSMAIYIEKFVNSDDQNSLSKDLHTMREVADTYVPQMMALQPTNDRDAVIKDHTLGFLKAVRESVDARDIYVATGVGRETLQSKLDEMRYYVILLQKDHGDVGVV